MAPNPANVVVGGTGAIFVAPEGTALPTTLAALAAPWIDLGYTSDEGATFNIGREQEEVNAWQSDEPVRVLVTAEPKSVAFELLEFGSVDAVELALRGASIVAAAGVATLTPPAAGSSDVRAMVIETEDEGYTWRFCYSRVALQGDVEWQLIKSDATRLPLEFGVQSGGWKILTDHPTWVAAALAGAPEDATAASIVESIGDMDDGALEQLAKDERATVRKAAKAEQRTRAAAATAG